MRGKILPLIWLSVSSKSLQCSCAQACLYVNEAFSCLALLSQKGLVVFLMKDLLMYVIQAAQMCSFPACGVPGRCRASWQITGSLLQPYLTS